MKSVADRMVNIEDCSEFHNSEEAVNNDTFMRNQTILHVVLKREGLKLKPTNSKEEVR